MSDIDISQDDIIKVRSFYHSMIGCISWLNSDDVRKELLAKAIKNGTESSTPDKILEAFELAVFTQFLDKDAYDINLLSDFARCCEIRGIKGLSIVMNDIMPLFDFICDIKDLFVFDKDRPVAFRIVTNWVLDGVFSCIKDDNGRFILTRIGTEEEILKSATKTIIDNVNSLTYDSTSLIPLSHDQSNFVEVGEERARLKTEKSAQVLERLRLTQEEGRKKLDVPQGIQKRQPVKAKPIVTIPYIRPCGIALLK
jgi:hypothetical protein